MNFRRRKNKDLVDAWVCATNCRLYEKDPGPDELNIGSGIEPLMVSRREAWRDFYTHVLLGDLDADRDRITALIDKIRRIKKRDPAIEECWGIATDLCRRACSIIDEAKAGEDDRARRRVLAGAAHLVGSVAIGQYVPAYQAELDNDLLDELNATEQ